MSDIDIKDLQAILDINGKINNIRDTNSILQDISNYAASLIRAEGASILLVDKSTGELYFEVAFGENAEALYKMRIPKGMGIAGSVAQTGNHIIVNDTSKDDRFYDGIDEVTKIKTRSLLAFPLTHNDQIIGVIELVNAENPKGFLESDVSLISQFAVQAGIAISNAFLYKEIQEKANELEYLFEISNLTNTIYERKRLFDKIVVLLSNAFMSDRISIMFVNEKTGVLVIESAIGIPEEVIEKINNSLIEDRISSMVASSGKLLYSNDIVASGLGRNKRLRYNKSSFISVPVKVKNIPIGVINVSEPRAGVVYSSSMIKTLQTIANQVGSAYESNRNYLERIEHEKIAKELDIMRMLQNALLISKFDDYKNMTVYAKMKPAKIVGGDFYDVYNISPGKVGFVIGDVSGKGLPASLFMAISRSVVKAYSYYVEDPSDLLKYANTIIQDDSRVGMFVTIFYGLLDLETGLFRYSNAGHNQQMIYRPSTKEFFPLSSRGIPLGVMTTEKYETSEISVQSGDVFITYTDGIVEAVNEEGEEFGVQRLKDVIRNYASTNSATLVNAVMRAVDEWAGSVPQWDDMTVLSFKRS
jgi:serine phosphatase RsbU (regulator of sigma subunit)/putative methionine-R-sulfoxide reductase with GAF domain